MTFLQVYDITNSVKALKADINTCWKGWMDGWSGFYGIL